MKNDINLEYLDSNTEEEGINTAIMKDDVALFIRLTNKINNINKYTLYTKNSNHNEYLIHHAVRSKSINILKHMIVSMKFDLYVKDKFNKTVLHASIEEGLCEIIQIIMRMPIDEIELCLDSCGNNELHKWVSHHSYCEACLSELSRLRKFKNGFLIDKNDKGSSPLHQAVIEEDFNAMMLLISGNYFSFDIENDFGENDSTIIHLAALSKNTEIFDYLIGCQKVDLNKKNSKLETALTVSLINENFAISEKLITLGARISTSDKRIAYEKSNKNLYSKLKHLYEEQHKSYTANKNVKNTTHHSNAERKSIIIINNEEVESQKEVKNCPGTATKEKYSPDIGVIGMIKGVFNLNLNLDSNSNNSNNSINLNEFERKSSVNSIKGNSLLKIPINDIKKSISEVITGANTIKKDSSPNSNPKSSFNSITKSQSPITTVPTLNSNFFLNNIRDTSNTSINSNLVKTGSNNTLVAVDFSTRRYTTFLNTNFNLESLINFEYIKSFTNLDINDVIKEELIYSADICKVYKGKYLYCPVAIKVYNIAKLKQEDIKYFISEVNLLMSLRHPHIVTFIGTCLDQDNFYIVTEYLEKKSLKNVIENKKIDLSELDKLKICQDIAIAILYLHSRKPRVFHRDLKSSNCLVDSNNRVKLCDFGLSKIYEELKIKKSNLLNEVNSNFYQTNCTSTSFWMAPEFITDNLFTDKADVYAFGILMWEVMMRDPVPYKNISEMAFLCGDKDILKKRPEIPKDFNRDIKELIEICWHHDYTQRPDITIVIIKIASFIANSFIFDKKK